MRSGRGQRMLFGDIAACRRCGRMLKSKSSVARSYGWTCWLKTVKPKLPRQWLRRIKRGDRG